MGDELYRVENTFANYLNHEIKCVISCEFKGFEK